MKITTNFTDIMASLATLKAVVQDKLASDNLKNIIFTIGADGKVTLVAYNTLVTCFAPLKNATVTWDDGETPAETYFQVRQELLKVLDNFKSLKKTVVDHIDITPTEAYALVSVSERATDEILNDTAIPEQIKASYNHVSDFRVTAPKLAAGVKKEIEGKDMSVDGTDMTAVDTKVYLDALLATIPIDAKETMGTRIMAVGSDIYTAPQVFFAIMENRLPDEFRDFILSSSASQFLKSYLDIVPEFKFSKQVLENAVILKFACEDSIAFINASTTKGALDCTAYKMHGNSGFAIDKDYFSDMIRRISGQENIAFSAKLYEDHCTGTIKSKTYKQSFDALTCRLDTQEFEGSSLLKTDDDGAKYLDIDVSIRPDLLAKLLFIGFNNAAPAFLYFEPVGGAAMRLAIRDNTGIWQTKINTLSANRSNFEW